MKYKSIVDGDYYDLEGVNHSKLEREKPLELLKVLTAQQTQVMGLMKVIGEMNLRIKELEGKQ